MPLSSQQVQALATDAVTLERARALTRRRSWAHLFQNDELIWGVCKSSGAALYDVGADAAASRFYCSCPSSRRPCKHQLALLLLYAEQTRWFRLAPDPPAWRDKLAPLPAPPAKSAAALQFGPDEKRLKLMANGFAALEQWLLDLVRQGLAYAEAQPSDFWEAAAAGMVDAKLGAIGARIRQWPRLFGEADWPDRLLSEIASLQLLAQAFRRRETLPAGMQYDLLGQAGVKFKKDEVLKQPGVADHWLVMGQVEGADEQLRYRRTWLLGERSQQMALLLDFAVGNRSFEMDWLPGSAIRGTLAFYPSAYPQRALVGKFSASTDPFEGLIGYADFGVFLREYAAALAANPWLNRFPALLDEVIPTWGAEGAVLVDTHRRALTVTTTNASAWRLIALGAGRPLSVFGEYDGGRLSPLAAFVDQRMVVLE